MVNSTGLPMIVRPVDDVEEVVRMVVLEARRLQLVADLLGVRRDGPGEAGTAGGDRHATAGAHVDESAVEQLVLASAASCSPRRGP